MEWTRPTERCVHSPGLEALIIATQEQIADPYLARLFGNALANTFDTTIQQYEEQGTDFSFVITGDIPAMWLRDSTAQVWPYLRLVSTDEVAHRVIAGVVRQQSELILRDPYANAFLKDASEPTVADDITDSGTGLQERKWEPDSLAYPMRLAHAFWKAGGDMAVFGDSWAAAMRLALTTLREQQRVDTPGPYRFLRLTTSPIETLGNDGYGWPSRPNGMVHSGFRPSDDACLYPFHIPTQHLLVSALSQLPDLSAALGDLELSESAVKLRVEIRTALYEHGHAIHPRFGDVWAYEVDGRGNAVFMDDPNIPGLLALPYLCGDELADDRYQRTRAMVLSAANPFFYSGSALSGLGSPHTGAERIWPMALISRALTSNDDSEIAECLRQLVISSGGRGLLNESVDVNDPEKYSRWWFAWCNSLFGELVLQLAQSRPHVLARQYS